MALLRRPTDCATAIAICDVAPQSITSCPTLTERIDDLLKGCIVTNLFPPHTLNIHSTLSFSYGNALGGMSSQHSRIPLSPDVRRQAALISGKYSQSNTKHRQSRSGSGSSRSSQYGERRSPSSRYSKLQTMLSSAKGLMNEIKSFEEAFEKKNHRKATTSEHKPIADKVDKYKKIRNELRNYSATIIQSVYRGYVGRKRAREKRKEMLDFLEHPLPVVEARLIEKRKADGRDPNGNVSPDDLNAVRAEKMLVKSELKRFDKIFASFHGKQPERNDKEPLRKLYQRYKSLTNMLNNQSKTQNSNHSSGEIGEEGQEGQSSQQSHQSQMASNFALGSSNSLSMSNPSNNWSDNSAPKTSKTKK